MRGQKSPLAPVVKEAGFLRWGRKDAVSTDNALCSCLKVVFVSVEKRSVLVEEAFWFLLRRGVVRVGKAGGGLVLGCRS